MKTVNQSVIAYPQWDGSTEEPYYDRCTVKLYNMTDTDIENPTISFTLAEGQSPSEDSNFNYTQNGNIITGHLTDDTTIPANQQYVTFAIGINGGEDVGALPSNFFVNDESADAPADAEAPSVPANIAVTDIGSEEASLSWDVSTDNTLVVGYVVNYTAGTVTNTLAVDTNSAILTGLTKRTEYSVTVQAQDCANNLSEPSEAITFKTKSLVPDAGPYDLSVAPYIDYMAWPQLTAEECFENTGIKNYTLAFIVAGTDDEGNIFPSWGGQSDTTYDARTGDIAKDDIASLREAGGDVAISFGGASGTILEEAITDTDVLITMYQQVIDNYQLKYIDFDFEGSALALPDALTRHVLVIEAIMDANPTLQVSYTLPVDGQTEEANQGLSTYGVEFIAMLAEADILPSMINGMTMDFGQDAPEDMFTGVQYALEALHSQVMSNWPELSSEEAWRRMGATPMFGQNDVESQTFTTENQSQLLEYAKEQNLGMLAGWSENRDNDMFSWAYSLIITDYQHVD
ncbi:fibronectin type III domain-containing protein [Salmonella enterica subsp. enterica]